MVVTRAEFGANLKKYFDIISYEDVFITEDGKTIAKLVEPEKSAVESIRGLLKNVPDEIDLRSLREERLKKYE